MSTMAVQDETVRQIVARVWRTEIGLPEKMDPTEQQAFLDQEGARIENLIEDQIPGQGPLVEQYRREHNQAPDYKTTVRLINMARMQASEQILAQELYSKVPEPVAEFEPRQSLEELAEEQQARDADVLAANRHDRDRWMRPVHRSEPTPEVQELVGQLWPHRTAWFRVSAQYLIQARSEDRETIPTGLHDPLLAEFTNQVEQELRAKGRVRDAEAGR